MDNLNTTSSTMSLSWIEDNICSIISSNKDDDFDQDTTLSPSQEFITSTQKTSQTNQTSNFNNGFVNQNDSYLIESSRITSQSNEGLIKRPLSPENVLNDSHVKELPLAIPKDSYEQHSAQNEIYDKYEDVFGDFSVTSKRHKTTSEISFSQLNYFTHNQSYLQTGAPNIPLQSKPNASTPTHIRQLNFFDSQLATIQKPLEPWCGLNDCQIMNLTLPTLEDNNFNFSDAALGYTTDSSSMFDDSSVASFSTSNHKAQFQPSRNYKPPYQPYHHHHQQNQHHNQQAYQKKLYKSSTITSFNSNYEENNSSFIHSFSFDNVNIVSARPLKYQPVQQPSSSNESTPNKKEEIVLHVRNLDYKISADEWKRILSENFRKHCKEKVYVSIVMNADNSLLGIVKLSNKDDVRLAISCLHHKKIGYKRLTVNLAYAPNSSNSPKSKVIALLKTIESNEMALTSFIELFEKRYNQSITISDLYKLKNVVHISYSKDGKGRLIRLATNISQKNLENEMKELMHKPYCLLHAKHNLSLKDGVTSWLPNVVVSLRFFKPIIHKLLNDHGGHMPVSSFLDCYRACLIDNSLKIDNENGVPLEHIITCAQDVLIKINEGSFKQIQWENDKQKQTQLSTRQQTNKIDYDYNSYEYSTSDEYIEDPHQRNLSQFIHEVVELFKGVPKCIIPLSKFNMEFNKKYGRQCRVADYGYTKLNELLDSIPHVLQIIESEYEKKLTLTHRVQVRRFSNDLIKVLKTHSTRQMFVDEYPQAYEKYFSRVFDIRDYGVCFLEDMISELSEQIISRKEIDERTFIQIPKVVQLDEERLCTEKLANDIIDLLNHRKRFSIQFAKFIPYYHHHFGRQCKLTNYGFTRLLELLDAMPEVVQTCTRDSLQFIQLTRELMINLVCENMVKLIEGKSCKLQTSLKDLETIYKNKFESGLCYEDFNVANFNDLFDILPLNEHHIDVKCDGNEYCFTIQPLNERELKRICRLALSKLVDYADEILLDQINNQNKQIQFDNFVEMLFTNNELIYLKNLSKRSRSFIIKTLSELIKFDSNDCIIGLTELYFLAKQIKVLFMKSNSLDLAIRDLDILYKQTFKTNHGIPYKKLGYVELNLLIIQGLSLMVNIKKYNDKRLCLNKEFWPKKFVDSTPTIFNQTPSPLTPNVAILPQSTTTLTPAFERTSFNTSGSAPWLNRYNQNISGRSFNTESNGNTKH